MTSLPQMGRRGNAERDCMRKILQIAKAQKSGEMFPPHPPGFGLTRKRVRPSARRWRRLAKGRPPKRHTEPRSGEGVWGLGGQQLPTLLKNIA